MEKDFLWVRDIIRSVKNRFQFDTCHNIIHQYRLKYANEPDVNYSISQLLGEMERVEALLLMDGVEA